MWVTIDAESILYVDRGRDTILLNRSPYSGTVVLKLTDAALAKLRAAIVPI